MQTLAESNEKNMDNVDKDMGYFKNAKCAGKLTENSLYFCHSKCYLMPFRKNFVHILRVCCFVPFFLFSKYF